METTTVIIPSIAIFLFLCIFIFLILYKKQTKPTVKQKPVNFDKLARPKLNAGKHDQPENKINRKHMLDKKPTKREIRDLINSYISAKNSFQRDVILNKFYNLNEREVVKMINHLRSNDRNTVLGRLLVSLSNRYGWKDAVDQLLRFPFEKWLLININSLNKEKYACEVSQYVKKNYDKLIQKYREMYFVEKHRDSFSWTSNCARLIEIENRSFLTQFKREIEIENIGRDRMHILDEARQAARAHMEKIPTDQNDPLMLTYKVKSELGEQRIEELYAGPPELGILNSGANAFIKVLNQYGIRSEVIRRMD